MNEINKKMGNLIDVEVIKEQRENGTIITTTKRNPWISSICCASVAVMIVNWVLSIGKIPDHIKYAKMYRNYYY